MRRLLILIGLLLALSNGAWAVTSPAPGLVVMGAGETCANNVVNPVDGATWCLDAGTGQLNFRTGGAWVAQTGSGSITGVVAGTGLNGGGTTGSVTLNLTTPVATSKGGTGANSPTTVGALAACNVFAQGVVSMVTDNLNTCVAGNAVAAGGANICAVMCDATSWKILGTVAPAILLNPMTTLGDMIYGGSGGAVMALAGNTTSTKQFLTSLGSGGAATAPAWGAILSTDLPPGWNPVTPANGGSGLVSPAANRLLITEGVNNFNLLSCGAGTTLLGNAADPTCSAALSLGVGGTTSGSVTVCNATGANCPKIGAQANSGAATVFNVPTGNGNNGQVLLTDGAGNTSWADPTVSGNKSNNSVAPGATNLGVLPAIANAAAQSWTEGNQVLLSTDLSGQLRLAPLADVTASGTITALNGSVQITLSGQKAVSYVLTGTWVATITAQVSVDNGTTWVSVDTYNYNNEQTIPNTTTNITGAITETGGANLVRVTATAFTSGTVSVSLRASQAERMMGTKYDAVLGSAVPKHAVYIAGTDGTNLQGLLTDTTGLLKNNITQVAGTVLLTGTGAQGLGSPRVTVATDSATVAGSASLPTGANTIGAVTQASGPWTANVTQFGGNAVATGTGAGGLGIPRVTISNDSSLAANQSVNVAQINGVAPLMGNGVTGTGSQRVTIASDNMAFAVNNTQQGTASQNLGQVGGTTTVTGGVAGLLAVGGNVANAGAATANPVPVGGIFTTTPTTLLTGQTATLQFTAAQNVKHDLTTVAGTATDTNSGLKSAGTLRVVLATDQPQLTNKLLVTPDALPANQSVNLAQVGGTATVTGGLAGALAVGGGAASGATAGFLNPIDAGAMYNATEVLATAGTKTFAELQGTQSGALRVSHDETSETCSTTVGAAAGSTSATLTGAVSKFTYLSSVDLSCDKAAAQGSGTATITGINGGTMNIVRVDEETGFGFYYAHTYVPPLVSSTTNTNLVANIPAIASGGTCIVAICGVIQ